MEGISSIGALNAEKGLKLVHWNIRSLVRKIDQIRILMDDSTIDVLTFSETWLKPHLHSGIVSIKGFEIFRQDRGSMANNKKRGGGLLTYVNDKHSSRCEPLLDLGASNKNIEVQWTLIHRPNCKNVVICNVYRPPTGDLEKAVNYLEDCLKTLNMNKINLFIMGDFNVNYKNKSSANYKKLHFLIQANSLSQHINTTTRNTDKTKSLIDLAITNSKFISGSGTLNHYVSDHQPIFLVHKKGRDARPNVEFVGRSYRHYNRADFTKALNSADWRDFYKLDDPELAWEFILKSVTTILDRMCPVKSFQVKNYRPDWITNELIEQIKDRDYFYSKAKRSGDQDAWNIAKHLRNTTNANIRKAKRDFILDELEANADNCKKFWQVIREIIPSDKQPLKHDILLKNKGMKLDKDEVADFINNFFINVGNIEVEGRSEEIEGKAPPMEGESCELSEESPEAKSFEMIRETIVHRVVKDINVSKSSGLDNVSSFVVKEAFLSIIPEVTYMYNLTLTTAKFPSAWKKALIVPIPKSGDLTSVQNYRPISLLPLPGKVLEKLIHLQLAGHLECNSLLIPVQHGFRRNHSTIHSVAQFTNYVNTKMDSGIPTIATYIDFRKAFDCVQHPVLLDKLSQLNFGTDIIKWVKSYLSSRVQRVYANNTYSSYKTIMQGVPQGSVLGPLFYIIYANDLIDEVKHCKVALYADDTVLYTASKNFDQAVSRMQKDIDSISGWCKVNGIAANTDKSKVMVLGSAFTLKAIPSFSIKIESNPLQTVTSYKYLGVIIDNQLSYNLHVNKLVASVSNKLKQFRRMRGFLNSRAALLVYKSMMLPVLEYGDVFLSAATVKNRKRLQVLQNKGLRCALNMGNDVSTDELHAEADLLKLHYRREQHMLNFMFDISMKTEYLAVKPEKSIVTRSQKKKMLKIKRPKTEKYKKSLAYRGPSGWNALPLDIHQSPDKFVFKRLVSNWVTQKAYKAQLTLRDPGSS